MLKKNFFIIIFNFFYIVSFSQLIYHQDVFYGGVTGGGFSTGLGSGSGNFDIYIEPGSTIKKAYLFTYRIGYAPDTTITLNNINYLFDTTDIIITFSCTSPYASPISICIKDITNDINPAITNYSVTIPFQPGLPINWSYWTVFLYVEYENILLNKVCSNILINDKNLIGNEIYNVSTLNPINTNFPVGFAIFSDRSNPFVPPNKQVFFNNVLLGLLGGDDGVNNIWIAAGVKGHFYYQNNTLYGLDDDTPDNVMGGTDGLANVSGYLNNNATFCNFQLRHINYPFQAINATHFNLAYFLTYTTPCDTTFSVAHTQDTVVCKGDSLQLFASGGINYEWLPQQGLSCYNCPNPIFYADSSRVYALRIWNTDSCSKVLPIRLGVLPLPTYNTLTTPATCGLYNDGILQVTGVSGPPSYIYHLYNANYNNTWTSLNNNKTYPALDSGTYTLTITNGNGCTNSSNITIAVSNNANTQFTANPQSGTVPLTVNLSNQSTGVSNCYYLLNNSITQSPVTITEAGEHQITLICFLNDTLCADTASTSVYAIQQIIIPTGFSPNGDGINDYFVIQGIEEYPRNELYIYNRWGELVYSAAPYQNNFAGKSNTNTFMGNTLTEGTYFYVFKLNPDAQGLTGFIELRR
jgi:gliding motility-associated-like protein